jgi:hypothetical protein
LIFYLLFSVFDGVDFGGQTIATVRPSPSPPVTHSKQLIYGAQLVTPARLIEGPPVYAGPSPPLVVPPGGFGAYSPPGSANPQPLFGIIIRLFD